MRLLILVLILIAITSCRQAGALNLQDSSISQSQSERKFILTQLFDEDFSGMDFAATKYHTVYDTEGNILCRSEVETIEINNIVSDLPAYQEKEFTLLYVDMKSLKSTPSTMVDYSCGPDGTVLEISNIKTSNFRTKKDYLRMNKEKEIKEMMEELASEDALLTMNNHVYTILLLSKDKRNESKTVLNFNNYTHEFTHTYFTTHNNKLFKVVRKETSRKVTQNEITEAFNKSAKDIPVILKGKMKTITNEDGSKHETDVEKYPKFEYVNGKLVTEKENAIEKYNIKLEF